MRNLKQSELQGLKKERLRIGHENELERKLRLEKVITNKHLVAMKTEEDTRARLENDAIHVYKQDAW